LAESLQKKPKHKIPLVVFESTLAPSSMATVIKEHFEKYGLIEGKDILLGNSPNRVMPGRLVERVTESDKLVAGLHPETPRMINEIYKNIVTKGNLHNTNSMTAEVVKTLENAYRDVRIAFSTEIVRYCDVNNINFHELRDKVNNMLAQEDIASHDPNVVPSGGILIPMIGVGGHCLPKDGILLWWRKYQTGADTTQSIILKSRIINDASPAKTIELFEREFEPIAKKKIAVLGAAYRFNSEDTRNSPSLQFALQILNKKCELKIHDPYVKPDDQNLEKLNLTKYFTRDISIAVNDAEYIVIGTAHKIYLEELANIIQKAPKLKGILDGSNTYNPNEVLSKGIAYTGIGRGKNAPGLDFVSFVYESFRAVETGLANEVKSICDFLNDNYASDNFNKISFSEVQRLAASCSTGCIIADFGAVKSIPEFRGFSSELAKCAFKANTLK
jgi:UDP-N-acetyl-D-mannosaminuronic acid dehydrogenase